MKEISKPSLIVGFIILIFLSCNNKTADKNAVIPQSYLDSVITAKTDSFKRSLNNKTDSLLLIEAHRQIDSIQWRDSLFNQGIFEGKIEEQDTVQKIIVPQMMEIK